MKRFYCNAKKDYCEKGICGSCEKYDGTGGNYIEVDENRKPTNFDRITESLESLAEYIERSQLCPDTIHLSNENLLGECKVYNDTGTCKDCIKEWLQKECEK